MSETRTNSTTLQDRRARGRGRRIFWVLLLAAALIAAVRPALGFVHGRGAPDRGRHVMPSAESLERMLDHLDVVGEPRVRIEAIVDGLTPELAALEQEGERLRERFAAILASEEMSESDIERLECHVRDLSERSAGSAVAAVFEIATELTPDQRAELVDFWARR